MYKETAIQSSFFTKSTLQCWLVYWMLYSELAVQWGSQAKLPIWQLKKSRCGLSGTIFLFRRIMNSLAHTLLIFFIFGIRLIKIAWVCQKNHHYWVKLCYMPFCILSGSSKSLDFLNTHIQPVQTNIAQNQIIEYKKC